jgi:hypothetical protein
MDSSIRAKLDLDKRYVAPIRQRRALVNNKLFVEDQRQSLAEEARMMKQMMVKQRVVMKEVDSISITTTDADNHNNNSSRRKQVKKPEVVMWRPGD